MDKNLYTLIIPTYNRPALLKKLITYLSQMRVAFNIMVLDSSNADVQIGNESFCGNSSLNINYRGYPEETKPLDKWLDGLNKVSSQYVSFCADDDFVFPDAIAESIDFLSRNHDYIACHGNYINFDPDNHANMHVEYSGLSIDNNSILNRFWQLMSNYEAIAYAIFKTNVIVDTFIHALEFPIPMYSELFLGVHPLIRGKVKRLPHIYYARRAESVSFELHKTKVHPLTYFANHTEEIFVEYARYRNALIKTILEHECGSNPDTLARYIDLIHSVYFMYSCDINQIIGLLNKDLGITVPVFENKTITCVPTVNHTNKINNVSRYDMICALKEIQRYIQS